MQQSQQYLIITYDSVFTTCKDHHIKIQQVV